MSQFQTSDYFLLLVSKKFQKLQNTSTTLKYCLVPLSILYYTLKCNSYKKFYFCKNQTHPVKFVELFLTKSIVGNLSKPKEAKSINRNGNFMCKCLPLPRQLPLTWFANLHHPMSFTSAPSKSP